MLHQYSNFDRRRVAVSCRSLCTETPFPALFFFFFFNDTPTTEIYTLPLHDALPICDRSRQWDGRGDPGASVRAVLHDQGSRPGDRARPRDGVRRSEEHTSELQSQSNLVCRLLLEKKKNHIRSFVNAASVFQF